MADVTETKHTAGPLTARKDAVYANGRCIAICDTDVLPASINEANARLFAAAPDLVREVRQLTLEVQEAANLLRSTLPRTADLFDAAADRARAALALATTPSPILSSPAAADDGAGTRPQREVP